MESTTRFTGNNPDPSEKNEGRTQVAARHDLASRFFSEQRGVPPARREAMGRALLEGVMFERPRQPQRVESRPERPRQHQEWHHTPLMSDVEYGPSAPVQQPGEGQPEAAGPHLNHGERLVRSEWHNIIVGADGRPVERNQYGQGFRQEQHVEQLPDATTDAQLTGGKASPSDDHAMMGSASANPLYQNLTSLSQPPAQAAIPSLPSGMTSPTLPPGHPLQEDPQHLLTAPKSRPAYKNPLIWVFFFVLLAVFFVASLAG